MSKLKVGDILIQKKKYDKVTSWLGHSAVVVDEGIIGDFPNLSQNYKEFTIENWIDNRKTIILRYKKFDYKFKSIFQKNVKTHREDKYLISLKNDNTSFYCSKYIWHLYKESAEELGYKLDLDSDNGLFIYPYDILYSSKLDVVQ